jgi:uncharacterized membrane protein YbhN (UPF0104 family)
VGKGYIVTRKRWMVVLGTAVSLTLLVGLLFKLDWPTFHDAIRRVSWPWIVLAGTVTVGGTLLRALRWTLIAGAPVDQFRFFCHATNLGYLGNALLPARAGEALRMVSISRSADLPMPQAVTSAVLDRIADLAMLAVAMVIVAAAHGTDMLSWEVSLGIFALIGVSLVAILIFLRKGKGYQPLVDAFSQRLPAVVGSRLPIWYAEAHDGLWPLRSRWRMGTVLAINLVVILSDYAAMWLVIMAFGWSLPFWAAATVGVFVAAGTSLPSAPGYVGVYQVACMLALRFYGIDGASAVAYAVVLQLLNLAVIALLTAASVLDQHMLTTMRKAQGSPMSNMGVGGDALS